MYKTQHNVLGYRTDLHFHDYKLAIEIDENGQERGCKFTRIEPGREGFDIFRAINETSH